MSLFQSLKDFFGEKLGSITSNLNVEDIQAQVTEQASSLKDKVTEVVNVDEVVTKVEEVTGNVNEKAQDVLSNITEKFKP